jgi:hypothetical protein
MSNRYFLKTDWTSWKEVNHQQYISAERNAGFLPKDPGVSAFSGHGITGRIISDATQPELYTWDAEFCKVAWPTKHCYECGNFVDAGTGAVHGRAGSVHLKCLDAY